MMELLQKKENGKIVMCNLGNFYVAIGKDATLLNNLLGLKVSCVKPEVCKVGFPVCALEKYTELLVQKRYSFIVYDFDQKKEELNTQRIYLRIMKKYRWIDEKKFKVSMELIYEIGKILGGLIKYYAKNNKKQIL